VLDRNHISTSTVSTAKSSATPDITPISHIAHIAPIAPLHLVATPAVNTITGTLLPEKMTKASLESLYRERELWIAAGEGSYGESWATLPIDTA
jgi:hypothetical protein